MKRLYVGPAFREMGLGAMMIASLAEKARASGYARICLETTHFMQGAMRLYREAAFVPCDAYYTIPIIFRDLSVFMRKNRRTSSTSRSSPP